ncbi:MAG: rod shape-determining protein RodA [Hyphomonadaceae bacterium]|nr:rod shape-determining protein RodA [Hyphomonadaceae bacterium]
MIRKDSLLYKLTQLHWFLLLTIIALAMFGTLVLFSAGSSAHDLATGLLHIDATYAIAHAMRFLLMLGIALVVALFPLRLWAAVAYPGYAIGVVMLIMVDFGGVVVNGAERWLQILPGFRLQPSELMKIAVPLALARYYHQSFSAGRNSILVHVIAFLLVAVPVALVLRQPDLGTALMILGTGCAVIFFAGISLRIVGGLLLLVAAMVPVVYFFALHDYQRQRIETMFNPEADPLGAGYQLQQGLIAIGSGGAAGKGFMEGAQKELDYIPEQHTDFIFTIVAEEFGFVGAVVILVAWGIALIQGMQIAGNSRSTFGGLAAAGFVSTLLLYVVINIGMVIGLLPVVGIPLPLISYGGTVIVTVMIGFGMLMAVHLNRANDMTLHGMF